MSCELEKEFRKLKNCFGEGKGKWEEVKENGRREGRSFLAKNVLT